MSLITGILLVIIFYILFADSIKKRPVVFYLGIYLWQSIVVAYYGLGYNLAAPDWFNTYFMEIFQRGIFSTMTFVIVMFLGTITNHNNITRKLMSIRGEISIIGCISIICHNIIFGVKYFPALFSHPEMMETRNRIAAIITIILLIIMIPLFVTSFKCIRRKMKAKNWKKLQRMAYPFFLLIYVHIMVLYTADIEKNIIGIVVYTIIYLSYCILRLRKYFLKKKRS